MLTVFRWLFKASVKVVMWAFAKPIATAAVYTGLVAVKSYFEHRLLGGDFRGVFRKNITKPHNLTILGALLGYGAVQLLPTGWWLPDLGSTIPGLLEVGGVAG